MLCPFLCSSCWNSYPTRPIYTAKAFYLCKLGSLIVSSSAPFYVIFRPIIYLIHLNFSEQIEKQFNWISIKILHTNLYCQNSSFISYYYNLIKQRYSICCGSEYSYFLVLFKISKYKYFTMYPIQLAYRWQKQKEKP